jgi:hypothetical protein
MCSGNPLGEMDLATKMEVNNPFFFFLYIHGRPPYNTDGGWWPLSAASAYGFVLGVKA